MAAATVRASTGRVERNNQRGRRNLTKAWEIELELGNKEDLAAIGKAKMAKAGGDKKSESAKSGLSHVDKPDQPKHNTQAEIAKAAGTSTGMVGMAVTGDTPDRPGQRAGFFYALVLIDWRCVSSV